MILARVHALPARAVPLARAVGCFSAEDLSAGASLPSFDNSAMDGYAVVAEACVAGGRLRVVGEQPAGLDRGLSVRGGEAIRIFTGAPLPRGADAVVMQEDVRLEGEEIMLKEGVAAGEFVRRRAGDVAAGQKLIAAGELIRPQMLPLLAAQGLGIVKTGARVRAAIVSTGDELAPPGAALQPGQIYESNSVLLQALLERAGVEVVSVTHAPDDADALRRALAAGLACDAMIVTGGVSVGARDLVKPALAALGVTLDLWRVAVKPGKPFLFGRTEGCAVFGLPGNPVSAFVTFLLFVRPALLKLMGANDDALALARVPARLTREVANEGDRPHYLRGSVREGMFTPVGRQESHALFGLARSNGLFRMPPNARIASGTPIEVLTWE